jgi:DnaK suppressor protein
MTEERLSQSDFQYFQQKLQQRMAQLRQEIEDVQERQKSERYTQVAGEAYDAVDASVAHLTIDTSHAEIRRDQEELREIEDALGRLATGSYGICLRCGEPIERARLEANPAAKRHQECEEAYERESATQATRL